MSRPSLRLLLVEDNPDDVAIVTRMLRKYPRADFQIEAVTSAQACIAKLKDAAFELVLLDHGLPDMSGVALLRALNAEPAAPPVIMLTGQGNEGVAGEAMAAGAYDYFPKDSITSEMLGHAIHQTLEKFRVERELRDEQFEGSDRMIFALASAAEAKDPMTEQHLYRMATYATLVGRELALDERQLLLLRYGALLHDIGKIGVSETILSKPGPLTDAERLEMRRHPIIGERICEPLKLAGDLCPIVRYHHERWDGQGYVDGLAGTEIPFLARIVGVVDAFDAMSNDRPYRGALPLGETLRRLRAGAGADWDPDITGVLIELIEREGMPFVLSSQRSKAA